MSEEMPDILSHWNYVLWIVSPAYGHVIAVMRTLCRPVFDIHNVSETGSVSVIMCRGGTDPIQTRPLERYGFEQWIQ
jgi:hypothetical protein